MQTISRPTWHALNALDRMTDNVVERVHVFKLLGVLLDDNLKWDSHVDAVCAKASIRLHFLKNLKALLA